MINSAIGTRENIRIIDSAEHGKMKVEVMEYQKLLGSTDTRAVMDMYFMEKQNIRARQVAVYLNNESVTLEPGAMSSVLGRVFSSVTTGEAIAQPEYKGTGVVVLEPSFRHFLLLDLEQEDIVVDKGMFYCAQAGVNVKPIMQKNVSSALLGGEGIFQIQLSGTGLVVLECPVPASEIDVIELQNETLKVDGNFAVLRSNSVQFTVERSAKTLVGSAVSGEGLVNVYKGTGQVWLAPTIKIYNTFNSARSVGSTSTGSMNMNTSRS